MSRTRGKGRSPSRSGKGRGKRAEWTNRREDVRYGRNDYHRDDRRGSSKDRRGQSKDKRARSQDPRGSIDERPRQHADLRDYDNPDHPDARRDLLAMEEDVNSPRELTDEFLTQIWEGHRNPKSVTFTVWCQDWQGRHPAVRISCRLYASSTWQRVPNDMLRYKKWSFIQQEENDQWVLVEADVNVSEYKAFTDNPFRMCVLMVRPFAKAFDRRAYMAVDTNKCMKSN